MKLSSPSLIVLVTWSMMIPSIQADVVLANHAKSANVDKPGRGSTAEVAKYDVNWQLIEDRLVARGSMLYTCWDTLRTRTGKTYTEVELKQADAVGITVSHRSGVDTIEYPDLQTELQTQLMYDPQEARDFKAGTRQPYLPAARKRSVQDRIAIALTQKHEAEVAAVEQKYEDRRLADERRLKAKEAWSEAREMLLKLEQAFYQAKGSRSLATKINAQKPLVAKRLKIYQQAQAAYDAIPSPLAH